MSRFAQVAFAAIAVFAMSFAAHGAVINGPSNLLTQGYADQLENWLGEGPIEVARVYAKQTGDDSLDFHAAADNKGRTFVLLEILEGARFAYSRNADDVSPATLEGPWIYWDENGEHYETVYFGLANISSQVIGGYNPQSWSTIYSYNVSDTDDDRDAFIFNLSTLDIQRQNLDANGEPSSGIYQTYNDSFFGPTFGGGADIFVSSDLTFGAALNRSYGQTTQYDNIVSGRQFLNELVYGRIEVFTIENIENSAVPEPSSYFSIAGLVLCLSAAGWRRRRRTTSRSTVAIGKWATGECTGMLTETAV